MVKKIKAFVTKLFSKRLSILFVVFAAAFVVLLMRLFSLQIVDGEKYANDFNVKITKERVLKSTRGNIYDSTGELLATNKLSNSVTIEDNGSYTANETHTASEVKDLMLNGEIYRLVKMIEANGDKVTDDFHIHVDGNGNFAFDIAEGTTLARFRADVYGKSLIDDLSEKQKSASADDLMTFLMSAADGCGLVNKEKPYTKEELESAGLPEQLSKAEQLQITIIRYNLRLTSFKKYMPVTVATNVGDKTVASIKENRDDFTGVEVSEDYIRVYNDAEYFASIIGYTGRPSAEELEDLNADKKNTYTTNSIIGKSGIENHMESTLQGKDGSEKVIVDSLGKVLHIDEDSKVDPVQGNDVHLTISADYQKAVYKILEQRIAGIILSNLKDIKSYDEAAVEADSTTKPISIYEVYTALFENSVIDITQFQNADASDLEKSVYQRFQDKQKRVIDSLSAELSSDDPTPYNDLDEEMQEYEDYIITMLSGDDGVLDKDKIDTSDETYKAWNSESTDKNLSLKQYLTYAASQNWIDITKLSSESKYLDSTEIYQLLTKYITEKLSLDNTFSKRLYHYMLMNDELTGYDVCDLLYDQGLLKTDDNLYNQYESGAISPFTLLSEKIHSLEITPAQLALDPCSGSAVLTNPYTGKLLACVSYPGYDNNRLANQMDADYYEKLRDDLSSPFYNKATQQTTAPGSTFKLVTASAGLTEGVITRNTSIDCTGVFGKGLVNESDYVRCSLLTGHGPQDVVEGIGHSCNVFFCTTGYRLGLDDNNNYSQTQSLAKLQEYAKMFGLDQKTGIEIGETQSKITDALPIPSAIGQGTNALTTVTLARYASTLMNRGQNYQLSLLDKTTDLSGNVIEQFDTKSTGAMTLADDTWNVLQEGMSRVVDELPPLKSLPLTVYGKTGTAQESKARPPHALFIGSAHGNGKDDLTMAVRIANGYVSTNAVLVAHDILSYYYGLQKPEQILTGTANSDAITNTRID